MRAQHQPINPRELAISSEQTEQESAPSPLPYTTPPPLPDEATDWDTLVAQTEQALREEGAPAAMIEAVIGHIRNQQSGQATPIQRRLIAEHSESPSTANEPEQSGESDADTATAARPGKRSKHP